MLRNPLPTKEQKNDYWKSWHIDNHPEIKTIDEIRNFSGEIIMTARIHGEPDPSVPPGIAGSNYYLSQRMLGTEDFNMDWMNQIAYSYFNPHLAIRTRNGLDASHPSVKWSPWEYTVMSGVILKGSNEALKTSHNRNSDVVTLYIMKEITTSVGSIIGSVSVIPLSDKSIPIVITQNGDLKSALLTIKVSGNAVVESNEGPQGTFIIKSQTVFYSIANIWK